MSQDKAGPATNDQAAGELRTATLTVTEAAIHAYAELTDDFNPIHLDAQFAATTPMGRQIAHGTMSLCLLWQWVGLNFPARTLGELHLDARFVKPVHIGDRLVASGDPDPDVPGQWRIRVRAQDGADRVIGTLRTGSSPD